MRLTLLAAVSALAFAACAPAAEAPADVAEAPAADAHAGHGPMDADMAAADAADDTNTDETPDGHMFHTYPAKVEFVHLPPALDGSWTATASHPNLVSVGEGVDETMPDGSLHQVFRVEPKASGNAEVKFERRDTHDTSGPVSETRIVKFMIH